jgi:phosphoribosylamine--glycine ligase
MKVFVIGSGGREHALAVSFARSDRVENLFWTPGNGATPDLAENPGIPSDDIGKLAGFAAEEGIDLTVVGPEVPLVAGIADAFAERGLSLFGPTRSGALLEGSKEFAKEIMREQGIPTASYETFTDSSSALDYLKGASPPYVIKADGLAAGKGVTVAGSLEEAGEALQDLFERRVFGASGDRVIVEEYLSGEEATVLALCDGERVLPLLSSQDHKPVFDGDRGPNTGGMGAIAPAPVVTAEVMGRVTDRVLLPLVAGLRSRNIAYRGVVYAGLMISGGEPSVVEFNCRFGDPEAEALLPLLESDLTDAVEGCVRGDLRGCVLSWREGYACDVVLASGGYPGSYEKGRAIDGLDEAGRLPDVHVYHAGTKRDGDRTVTAGGRVLNVVGLGRRLRDAVERSYDAVEKIRFEGAHCRRDIGHHGLHLLGDRGR